MSRRPALAPSAIPRVQFTATDLIYDEATHTSMLPDGRPVPHVTAILGAVGVSTDFAAVAERSARMAAMLETARDRGTAVHADAHAYDDDDLIWETVDPRVLPYVRAWAQVRAEKQLTPVSRERRIYHPTYNYTGFLDGVFRRSSREGLTLIDIKTGDPNESAAHLQTAGYASAWNIEHLDNQIDERWSVWLRPGRVVPYTIADYTAQKDGYQDFQKFLACVTTYNEQPSRRARRS